ncbi:ABC-three component system middle component 6 [Streptococcus suis]|uniref:ABC-three component system middle component 6 n=1 Tax=Streptococcus suis TaxID=1307 RepID=UPI0037D0D038
MDNSLIIERDSIPKNTIYYISGCIIAILRREQYDVDNLFEKICDEFNESLEFTNFILSLDFLFLINKINISEKGILRCI